MSEVRPIPRPRVSEAPKEIQHLLTPPAIAWPTVILAILATALYFYGLIASLLGYIALWQGCLIVTLASYIQFTPLHDASHRAISSRWDWLNTFFVNWCFYFFIPFAISGHSFRYFHMQHHRFANDTTGKDPDHWVSGQFNWHLPLRCLTIVGAYLYFFLKIASKRPRKEILIGLGSTIVTVAIGIAAHQYDKADWFWICLFLPIFLASGFLSFAFDWLPHNPHDVPEQIDPYQATIIREKAAWFLTPVLLYQNYHLLHHLYPRVPFYRYSKVWFAMRDTFIERGARIRN